MIGSKASAKIGGGKMASKIGDGIGGALSGLAGLFGGQDEQMQAPAMGGNPLMQAAQQQPVNGAQWRPMMRQPQQGMFDRLAPRNPLLMGGLIR